MSKSFKPISFEINKVGRRIKSTKCRYLWRFELDSREYEITLYISKLSGKRRVLLNGDVIAEEIQSSSTFGSYPLRIGSHSILIFELNENKFDLRVDSASFEADFHKQRNAVEFSINNSTKVSEDNEDLYKPYYQDKKSPGDLMPGPSISIVRAAPLEAVSKTPIQEKVMKPTIDSKPKAPEPMLLDLLDLQIPPIHNTVPDDLFSIPLSSSTSSKYNPFEESTQKPSVFGTVPKIASELNKSSDLFDLDASGTRDFQSPSVQKKPQFPNNPVNISENPPIYHTQNMNSEMMNLQMIQNMQIFQNMQMMNNFQMMNGNYPSAHNPFLTGPNPWNANPK